MSSCGITINVRLFLGLECQSEYSPERPQRKTDFGVSTYRCQHFREVRCSQSSDRIPPFDTREARSSTSLITTRRDIVQVSRVVIQNRVDEPNRCFAEIQPRTVNQRYDTTERGRTSRSSVDVRKGSVDGDDVIDAVRRDIRVAAGLHRSVVTIGSIGRLVVCKVGFDGASLIGWHGKDIRETAAGIDD